MAAESAIYKVDGYRILAASSQRALSDSDGSAINTTYLKKADFTAASGKWEDAADVVDANSGDWNKVSAKLDTSSFETWSANADVTPYTTANNYITISDHAIGGYDWTNTITASADAASANAVSTVEGKFTRNAADKITAYNGSAFANDTYTGGTGIDITNNEISVTGQYITSADTTLNDKNLVLRNNAWVELQETGAFEVATGTGTDLHPDVSNPSKKVIYLVKDSTVTSGDSYKEWIYSDSNTWELIGDTQMDLSNYATTSWVDSNYISTATTSTNNWDVVAYSGKDGISVANHEIGLSSDYVTAIQDVSSKLGETEFQTWSASKDFDAYSAGANIDITNHVVSGKDWTTEIQDSSANAVSTVEGRFTTSSDGSATYITAYNNTGFYVPNMGEYVTTAQYQTDSAVWQDAASCVSANSGAWTHAFTMIEVPDLANVPDIAP
jgi:hypothetical protein